MRWLLSSLIGALALSACTQFPELDAAVDPGVYDREFPKILPIEPLLKGPERRVSAEVRTGVLDRAAALRARATRLGGPVVDAATKARMARGVRR